MELLLLGIFSAVLLACIFTGVSVIYAMLLGLVVFFGYGLIKKENLETNAYFFLERNENGEKCFTDIYVDWNDDCHLACKWFHCIYRLLCI